MKLLGKLIAALFLLHEKYPFTVSIVYCFASLLVALTSYYFAYETNTNNEHTVRQAIVLHQVEKKQQLKEPGH